MTKEEILEKLEKDRFEINELDKLIISCHKKISDIRNNIKPPCQYCRLDGFYRCDACSDADFVGFNNEDWY